MQLSDAERFEIETLYKRTEVDAMLLRSAIRTQRNAAQFLGTFEPEHVSGQRSRLRRLELLMGVLNRVLGPNESKGSDSA